VVPASSWRVDETYIRVGGKWCYLYRTLKGMEAMHSLRKGQGTMFAYGQPNPDAVIVNRVFETA